MKIIDSPRAMQALCEDWRCANEKIGFVPTMGALHQGHLELCRRARNENTKFVTSIFVNPLQFRAGEDLDKYPRPFERDHELLENAGCDALFFPTRAAMYSYEGENPSTATVDVSGLSTRWEGELRPGHFRGVTTVVAKLFNIVHAHRAYFGEKDFQQLKIIERMASDLNYDIEIVACPTIREVDGLALSSRNAYLNSSLRAAVPVLYHALQVGQAAVKDGENSAVNLVRAMREIIEKEFRIELEYLAVVDSSSLEPLETLSEKKPARALIAARAGSTRLIDNIALNAM